MGTTEPENESVLSEPPGSGKRSVQLPSSSALNWHTRTSGACVEIVSKVAELVQVGFESTPVAQPKLISVTVSGNEMVDKIADSEKPPLLSTKTPGGGGGGGGGRSH
jgi:hypothetical protein